LVEHGIDADAIRTLDDFHGLPILTKESYVDQWPLRARLTGGTLSAARTISRSSGSSGRARSWPRGRSADVAGADLYAPLLDGVMRARERDVLCVVAFAMGTWTAGTYTVTALETLAARGLRLSVLSPGIDVESLTEILRDLAPHYDATVLFGYPPFVLQALEHAARSDVDLPALTLTCALSGEATTETFRRTLRELTGRDDDAALSVYAAADIGLIAVESPAAAALRGCFDRDIELRTKLVGGAERLPTLFELDDRHVAVESDDGRLLFTTGGAMPLVRYALGDHGTVLDAAVVDEVAGVRLHGPVLALRGRHDACATFYGISVYAEQLREALDVFVERREITGRFVLAVREDDAGWPLLMLAVEIPTDSDPSPNLDERVAQHALEHLCTTSSEFRALMRTIGLSALPQVRLATAGSEPFTNIGAEHRWIELPST